MHITDVFSEEANLVLRPKYEKRSVDGKEIIVPYPSPADWRDQWIYFLLVDRFNNPDKPPKHEDPYLPYQGGTFEGIKQKVNYLKDLGVGAIWLSPVQFNPQWFNDFYGGYGIQDFLRIEPRFCKDPNLALNDPDVADKEFRELVDYIHSKDMYVICDIVLNHVGDLYNYEGMKDAREWNNEPYDIYWRDTDGTARGNWKEIENINNLPRDAGPSPRNLASNKYFRRQGADGPNHDGDFYILKELLTTHQEPDSGLYTVRNILIRIYQIFIGKFDIDGYRIDTLQYVSGEFSRIFGNAMREYALSIGKKNFMCFGEVWQDDDEEKIAAFVGRDTQTAHGIIGVDSAIDFPMRYRLVNVIKSMENFPPVVLADHFEKRKEVLKKVSSSHGDATGYYITFLDNHDLNERFHVSGWEYQTTMALTCLFTMAGIPCIYYGTEQGLDGRGANREYVREALWGHSYFNPNYIFYKEIQVLSQLRDSHPALRYGRQYFRPCSGDGINFGHSGHVGGILAYSRILNENEILIVANLNTQNEPSLMEIHILIDKNLNENGANYQVLHSNRLNPQAPNPVVNGVKNASLKVFLKPMEIQVLSMKVIET